LGLGIFGGKYERKRECGEIERIMEKFAGKQRERKSSKKLAIIESQLSM
jgi:hypothetical protein